MTTLTDIFGPAIHTHTRADALADGTLHAVPARESQDAGIVFPVALTAAAWADCVAWGESNDAVQDETGRLWDVLTMARWAILRAGKGASGRLAFQVARVPNSPRALQADIVRLDVVIGPGDNHEPVLTILTPDED